MNENKRNVVLVALALGFVLTVTVVLAVGGDTKGATEFASGGGAAVAFLAFFMFVL